MAPDDLMVVKEAVLNIRDDVREIKGNLERYEERLRLVEIDSVATKTRIGIFSALAGSIGLIAAAVAAWLGTR